MFINPLIQYNSMFKGVNVYVAGYVRREPEIEGLMHLGLAHPSAQARESYMSCMPLATRPVNMPRVRDHFPVSGKRIFFEVLDDLTLGDYPVTQPDDLLPIEGGFCYSSLVEILDHVVKSVQDMGADTVYVSPQPLGDANMQKMMLCHRDPQLCRISTEVIAGADIRNVDKYLGGGTIVFAVDAEIPEMFVGSDGTLRVSKSFPDRSGFD